MILKHHNDVMDMRHRNKSSMATMEIRPTDWSTWGMCNDNISLLIQEIKLLSIHVFNVDRQVGCTTIIESVSQTKWNKRRYYLADLFCCWRAQNYVIYTPHGCVFKTNIARLISPRFSLITRFNGGANYVCIDSDGTWFLIFRQNNTFFTPFFLLQEQNLNSSHALH